MHMGVGRVSAIAITISDFGSLIIIAPLIYLGPRARVGCWARRPAGANHWPVLLLILEGGQAEGVILRGAGLVDVAVARPPFSRGHGLDDAGSAVLLVVVRAVMGLHLTPLRGLAVVLAVDVCAAVGLG